MRTVFRISRWFLVTAGVILLTAVSIDATDNFSNISQSALGILASGVVDTGACPAGMVVLSLETGDLCVDAYEVSVGSECPHQNPQNILETKQNIEASGCLGVTEEEKTPWRHVARHQAETICAQAGKRLPSNEEWYRASLGTPDRPDSWGKDDCNLGNQGEGGPHETGSHARCLSSVGAYDMVGNVWEWVSGDVHQGAIDGQALPESGYVTQIDGEGIARATDTDTPDEVFNRDYFWSSDLEHAGIIRGGFWGTDSDGGVYSVNTVIDPSKGGVAIGFRCVK